MLPVPSPWGTGCTGKKILLLLSDEQDIRILSDLYIFSITFWHLWKACKPREPVQGRQTRLEIPGI